MRASSAGSSNRLSRLCSCSSRWVEKQRWQGRQSGSPHLVWGIQPVLDGQSVVSVLSWVAPISRPQPQDLVHSPPLCLIGCVARAQLALTEPCAI